MRKILFVVNPVAGSGKAKDALEMIKNLMKIADISHDVRVSNREGNVLEVSKWATKNDFTDIVAVGGDGTLIEVVSGIEGYFEKINVGIIPCGTGNDFARTVGIPFDHEKNIMSIIKGETRKVDTGRCNGQMFINSATFGLDGEVVKNTQIVKKIVSGPSAYLLSTIKTLATYKSKKVRIKIDELTIDRDILIIAVGNGKYIGGGMKITPNAEVDDELLNICIVNKTPKLKLLSVFPLIFKGKHISCKEVEMFDGKEISIICIDDILDVNLDGTLVGTTPVEIDIFGDKINVLVD